MSGNWWTKFVAVVAALLVSGLVLTVALYPVDRENPESWPAWYATFSEIVDASITPGLDLQGGLHVQYQVDVDAALHDKVVNFAEDIRRSIAEQHPDVRARVVALDDAASIRVTSNDRDPRELLDDDMLSGFNLIPSREGANAVRLDVDSNYIEQLREDAVSQAIETIERRINDLGLAEPSIQARGSQDIIIQLPGIDEERIDNLLQLIETTAQLEFRLLAEQDATFWARGLDLPASATNVDLSSGYPEAPTLGELKDALSGVEPPEGTEIGYEEITEYNPSTRAQEAVGYRARLMESRIYLTGDSVTAAQPATDPQFNQPIVSMQFDRAGASAMGQMTGDNIGRGMVVVLDEIIVSIATIEGRITNRGQITMGGGGNFDELYSEVERICVSLRNGALVAPIEKQFETRVGPTLGRQSIEAGRLALTIGFGLVMIFILFYYKLSGVFATFALASNLLFIFAILAGFQATLTLPGLAGITLTIGMAVDANVIIFERIREEIAAGSTPRGAVEAGYAKAFSAIIDGNLTTGIAAVVLYQFGSGPIRGFALTLLIGIICSLFSAIIITRVLFDFVLEKFQPKRLSI